MRKIIFYLGASLFLTACKKQPQACPYLGAWVHEQTQGQGQTFGADGTRLEFDQCTDAENIPCIVHLQGRTYRITIEAATIEVNANRLYIYSESQIKTYRK